MTHPRVHAVEDNLLRMARKVAGSGIYPSDPADDVAAFWSDVPFPMFNLVMDARFDDPARVAAIADEYVARGLPCLWWATPSTTPPGLRDALLDRGFVVEDVPGMHRPLDEPIAVNLPPGVTIDEVGVEAMLPTMIAGFEMPDFLTEPFQMFMGLFGPDELHHLLAHVDGEPVAVGAVYIQGATAGIYNVATLEAARGRGIGTALTATLMELARTLGCNEVILHATEVGRPVYEKLGFETVCFVPQFVWVPAEPSVTGT